MVKFVLPRIVQLDDPVPYKHPNTPDSVETRTAYRLSWYGKERRAEPRAKLGSDTRAFLKKTSGVEPLCIGDVLELPADTILPPHLSYSLAINRGLYTGGKVRFSHVGLPPSAIDKILNTTFLMDRYYWAAARYLKHLSETHWPHPLLTSFDTCIRDMLLSPTQEMVRSFFSLLQDCIYNPETRYHARYGDGLKESWDTIAGYFFWTTGKTGLGLRFRNVDLVEPKVAQEGAKQKRERTFREVPGWEKGIARWEKRSREKTDIPVLQSFT
jgi:hypothetical protein